MARIEITQPHSLTLEQARGHIDELARGLGERFGLSHAWEGDTLNVSGSGVTGDIALHPSRLDVAMELGFPLSMMHGAIEERLRASLQQHFGSPA